MSKLSIFKQNWLDLVFENKNKEYGAYQLRKESSNTSFKSFLLTVALVCVIYGATSAFSYYNPDETPEPTPPPIIFESDPINIQKKEPIKVEEAKPVKKSTGPKSTTPDLNNLKIEKNVDPTAPQPVENKNVPSTPYNPDGDDSNKKPVEVAPKIESPVVEVPNHGTKIFDTPYLEKQPSFPGGIKNFLNYVAKNFRPADDLESTIKVTVSFIVEKDGTLSNIKVIKDPGFGMGDEAIRVLKSLKEKWEPGVKDGQKVRTTYNLPIAIQI